MKLKKVHKKKERLVAVNYLLRYEERAIKGRLRNPRSLMYVHFADPLMDKREIFSHLFPNLSVAAFLFSLSLSFLSLSAVVFFIIFFPCVLLYDLLLLPYGPLASHVFAFLFFLFLFF